MSLLGQSIPRIDARGKVTGETLYPGDIYLPDMLHMKLLFAGRPHARIRAIDTSSAEAMPGVVAILTAKDVRPRERCARSGCGAVCRRPDRGDRRGE